LHYIQRFGSYITENTVLPSDRRVSEMLRRKSRLFEEKHEKKNRTYAQNAVFFMLHLVGQIISTGLQRVKSK